jgi:hypothetical protein
MKSTTNSAAISQPNFADPSDPRLFALSVRHRVFENTDGAILLQSSRIH